MIKYIFSFFLLLSAFIFSCQTQQEKRIEIKQKRLDSLQATVDSANTYDIEYLFKPPDIKKQFHPSDSIPTIGLRFERGTASVNIGERFEIDIDGPGTMTTGTIDITNWKKKYDSVQNLLDKCQQWYLIFLDTIPVDFKKQFH